MPLPEAHKRFLRERVPAGRNARRSLIGTITLIALAAGGAIVAPARASDGLRSWSSSSGRPVATLDRPSIELRAPDLMTDRTRGFRFIVYGDQRALADGEWQNLMRRAKIAARADSSIRFLVDEGDIVQNGRHSDQFWMLRDVLGFGPEIPYLVAVGNHEVGANGRAQARANTATFLKYLDPEFSPDRMWYRKDIGAARFFFLDSNDLVYGDRGDRERDESPPPGSRAERQLEWLVRELGVGAGPGIATVVVMHHPILQSSTKELYQARSLWNYVYEGRALSDILADGGVDLILCGHTHTYERFVAERKDGRKMTLVNLSGRPRDAVLGFGAGARRAHDLRGGELEYFGENGWKNLDRWRIRQEDPMLESEANQFGIVTVGGDGSLLLDVRFLDDTTPDGMRPARTVQIR